LAEFFNGDVDICAVQERNTEVGYIFAASSKKQQIAMIYTTCFMIVQSMKI
jgi:hypothetical protein